jgi:hypothetical protein
MARAAGRTAQPKERIHAPTLPGNLRRAAGFGLVSADAPPAQAQDKSVTLKMSSWVLLRTL